MEIFLKKYFWLVTALAVALCAAFLAKAAGHLIAAEVLLTDRAPPVRYAGLMPAAQPAAAASYGDIAQRDIFCSTCAPPPASEPAAASSPTGVSDAAPVKTTLPLTYVASILCPTDPRWSFATIRDNSDHTAAVYRVGSPLPTGGGWVTEIRDDRVLLQNNGRLEYLPLIDTTSGAVPGEPPRPLASGDPFAADVERGVHKVNDFQFQIDRGLLDKVLANTAVLGQAVRLTISTDPSTGRPNGYKLYGIRPGSIMAAIGFDNGDVISALNGNDISTPDKALEAYNKLRNASIIAVSIQRGGQSHEIDYTIH